MITRIRGTVNAVLSEEVRLQVGPFEYELWVPEIVRRRLQLKIGEEIEPHVVDFLEGNPARGGKMMPRMIGFLDSIELEFFELFCTADGVGMKTALKAMCRPIHDIAAMIRDQEAKALADLPGISVTLAERIIAKLRKKMARFAYASPDSPVAKSGIDAGMIAEVIEALRSVGHSEVDARRKVDKLLNSKRTFKSTEDMILAAYQE